MYCCFSNLFAKSNESLTMCGIKDKGGSIMECKISDIALVWETGLPTIGRPPIKISSSI